jgi:ribosomal protein S18 acetylase RimI-like enzyme
MTEVVVRRAEQRDLVQLCRLYHAFHEFHAQDLPDRLHSLGPAETFDCAYLVANLGKLLDRADAAIFVADVDTTVVGLAEVYLCQDQDGDSTVERRYGYLQSLMVNEAKRGQGIGSQLLVAAEQWVREQGVGEIQLQTWEFPRGPQPFYERSGYQTLRRILVREL